MRCGGERTAGLLDVGDLGLHESGVLSRELLELDHDCGGRPLVSAEHVGEVRQVSAERAVLLLARPPATDN